LSLYTGGNIGMKKVLYKFVNGEINTVEVTDDIAEVCKGFDREEERQRKSRNRHCKYCLDIMNDKDTELGVLDECDYDSKNDYAKPIQSAFLGLTNRQLEVAILLMAGKTYTEISKILGVSQQTINDIKLSIKGKFEKFFKSALKNGAFCPSI
jgi:ATP/maltotriose-dependent transcriptional regulator MalT